MQCECRCPQSPEAGVGLLELELMVAVSLEELVILEKAFPMWGCSPMILSHRGPIQGNEMLKNAFL